MPLTSAAAAALGAECGTPSLWGDAGGLPRILARAPGEERSAIIFAAPLGVWCFSLLPPCYPGFSLGWWSGILRWLSERPTAPPNERVRAPTGAPSSEWGAPRALLIFKRGLVGSEQSSDLGLSLRREVPTYRSSPGFGWWVGIVGGSGGRASRAERNSWSAAASAGGVCW